MKLPLWAIALIRKAFPSRFFLSRLTKRFPAFARLIDFTLFRGDHITYLPNNRTIAIKQEVAKPENVALPASAIEHFIDKAGSLVVLNSCICRESAGCRNHPIDLGCLFMGDAVSNINPKLARPVSKQEAREHLRRAEDENLIFLIARNHIDTLWTGARPGTKLLTVCFCCDCCCLWKALPYISDTIAARVNKLPGIQIAVNDNCVGCGKCTEGCCFADAIAVENSRAVIDDNCRGCGRCVTVCPNNALDLHLPKNGSVQGLIEHLETLVDVE
ncbi:MAG: 4Fe-4S binding protein [Spirochaetales bacterium]|jgi:ferredoxin|nr:4Fe-4S binding protein [Spirochaetales bacterium]